MARARGCAIGAVLAGTIVCWAAAEGAAIAQEAPEVTEDLGNSYLLARRTTSQGSIIETVLFAGEPIVTDIVVPAPDEGITAKTTRAVARTPADSTSALPSHAAAALPPSIGSGFGGTWLSGEIIEEYLVLHRIRASAPVTHDFFRQGRKVGSVTEVGPPIRAGSSTGRNSFAFESTGDRFVVSLTQPDGTRILAATEYGHSLGQVVVPSAALAVPPRTGAAGAVPPGRLPGSVGLSIGRSPEPQPLVRPQEADSIRVEEPTSPGVLTQPDTVPLPRPSIRARPARTVSRSPVEDSLRSTPEPMTGAPGVKPKPATISANDPPPAGATNPRPIAPATAAERHGEGGVMRNDFAGTSTVVRGRAPDAQPSIAEQFLKVLFDQLANFAGPGQTADFAAAAARAKPVAQAPPSSASPAAKSVVPASSCYYPGVWPSVWDSSRSMWVTPCE